tara:strand:+ start:584 stop:1015 length:432 start_codon:yes stop_codon:yes gene_type:complete
MKVIYSKIGFLFIVLIINSVLKIKADNLPLDNISGKSIELLIESNKQRSYLENFIFYAEGNVIITNESQEFIAKSKKAIFYKLLGKIKLLGNVEVLSGNVNKIKAGEVIYYLKENKFEAISGQNEKVNTKFVFNGNNSLNEKI